MGLKAHLFREEDFFTENIQTCFRKLQIEKTVAKTTMMEQKVLTFESTE